MSGGHDRIGPTAHYTAYVWRRLGLPYAEVFATRKGAALYWGFFAAGEWMTRLSTRVPSMREYLEYRHRLIDLVVEEIAPDRLVELGAGLSPRGLAWAVRTGVEAIDVDLPHVARLKRDALARVPVAAKERLRVVDDDVLSDGFGERLSAMLEGARRPVVVAEGLLSYLDLPDRLRLFETVADALRSAGGGVFVSDLHTVEDQARVGRPTGILRFAIRVLTRRKRALDPFASRDAMAAAFSDAGFDRVDVVDAPTFADREPRLAKLHSPALIVRAGVE
jgi:O-methyltransferase involved in polyketide biosynthesis